MKRSAKIMLTLATVFTIITAVFFMLTCIFSVGAIDAINKGDFGDALGGVFLYIIGIMFSCFTITTAIPIFPFACIFQAKNGKSTSVSISMIVFAVVAIVASFFFTIYLPVTAALKSASSN